MNTFREIKEATGMTAKELSETLNIPIPTIEAWCRGTRTPPQYVLELIIHRLHQIGKLALGW